MRLKTLLVTTTAAAALAVPALAQADKPATPSGNAYGKYCQNQSKHHVSGQQGTPFTQCIAAMRKADVHRSLSASQACKALSKKHVKGQKNTPFSKCVVAAAKLRSERPAS